MPCDSLHQADSGRVEPGAIPALARFRLRTGMKLLGKMVGVFDFHEPVSSMAASLCLSKRSG